MSKIFTNQDKVERVKEPLFQVNRMKYRGPRNSELENAETNFLKLDLTRIKNQLDSVDTSILEDLTLFIGDINDINESVLLDDGLSYNVSGVSFLNDNPPEVLERATVWIDAQRSAISSGSIANLGSGGSAFDATFGSSVGTVYNGPKFLDHNDTNYIYLPGNSGNYVTVGDSASLDITGDLEIVVRVALDKWVNSNTQTLLDKVGSFAGYGIRITSVGNIIFTYGNGTAYPTTPSTNVVPPFIDGVTYWIKMTVDVDNGSSGNTVKFYYTQDQETEPTLSQWIQIGTDVVTAGVAVIANSPVAINVGTLNDGVSQPGAGKYYRAIVRNGIGGTKVLDLDFTTAIISGSEFSLPISGTVSTELESVQYIKNSGSGGSSLDARLGSTGIVDGGDPKILNHTGTNFLYLSGVAGNYVSIPDTSVLDISGDLEIEVIFHTPPDWTVVGNNGAFVGKEETGQRSFSFRYGTGVKRLALAMTKDGSTASIPTSSVDVPTDTNAIKVTVDIDNGAGGYTTTFYTSNNRGVTYSQLGATSVGTGTFPIFAGTAALNIGQTSVSGVAPEASYRRVIVRNGIGGPAVVDIDFTTGITDGGQYSLPATIGSSVLDKSNAAYVSNLGSGGVLLDARRGSLPDTDTADPDWLIHTGVNYYYSPGTTGNSTYIHPSAALDITGDHEIIACIAADSWATASQRFIFIKGVAEVTANYSLQLNTNDDLVWAALTSSGVQYSAMNGFKPKTLVGNGKHIWVRMTRVNSTGLHSWYYSTDSAATIPSSWTTASTETIAAGATLVTAPTSSLYIPLVNGMAGKYYRVIVKNGATTVLDVDFTTGITTGAQSSLPITTTGTKDNSQYASNLGTGGVALDARKGSSAIADVNDPEWLVHTGTNYIYLPGVSGNYIALPDRPGWTPASSLQLDFDFEPGTLSAAEQSIVSHFGANGDRGWRFSLGTTSMALVWSPDGTDASAISQGVTFSTFGGMAVGKRCRGRMIFRYNNGSGNYDLRYYTKDELGATTLVSTITGVGTTSIFNSTGSLEVGSRTGGGTNFTGKMYSIQITVDGVLQAGLDFTTGITNGAQNTLPITSAAPATDKEFSAAVTNLGTGGIVLDARRGSAAIGDSADPAWLVHNGTNYLYLPGVSGNYMSIPTTTALNITSDIEIVFRCEPSSIAAARGLLNRQGGWRVICDTGIGFTVAFGKWDGTSWVTDTSTGAILVAGTDRWYRVRHTASTGVTTFEYAPGQISEPTTWTLDSTKTIGAGLPILNPSAALEIGSRDVGIGTFEGKFYRAIVRNGVSSGVTVADIDLTTALPSGSATSVVSNSQIVKNLGSGGDTLNAVRGSTSSVDGNDPAWLPYNGTNYLYIPDGTSTGSNYATSPASTALDAVIGDLELVIRYRWDGAVIGPADNLLISRGYSGQFFLGVNTSGTGYVFDCNVASATPSRQTKGLAAPIVAGLDRWVRVTRSASTGEIKWYHSLDHSSTEPVGGWTLIGTSSGTAGNLVPSTTSPLEMGRWFKGALHRVIVRGSFTTNYSAPSAVFDANFAIGITSGSQVSFTESSANAATVTINRGTAGRKSVTVTRPTLLLGTDDYLEVADNALLNFSNTDSFTVVAVTRQWATPPNFSRTITKFNGTSPGWAMLNNATTAQRYLSITDGTNTVNGGTTNAYTLGALNVTSAVRSVSLDNIVMYNGTTATAGTTDTTTGTLSNTLPLRIGADATGQYADFEFFGAAVWRRALSAAEISTINDHYNGTITTASNTLLQEAVLWLDANSSQITAAINRSTSGRKSVAVTKSCWLLGTDDYFEIQDSPLLNFSATESFTVLANYRQWNTPLLGGRIVSKANSGTITGWQIANNSTTFSPLSAIGDGTTQAGLTNIATTAGVTSTVGMVVNRSSQTITAYTDLAATATGSTTSVGSITNSYSMRIGSIGQFTGSPVEIELFGVNIWRRALSAGEVTTVVNHYNGIITSSSIALLQEAVFWIDSNLSQQAAAIGRSSTDRKTVAVTRSAWLLGANDYFEIPNSSLLNFSSTESFSVFAAIRQHGTPSINAPVLGKVNFATLPGAAGWQLYNNGTTTGTKFVVADTTSFTGVQSSLAPASGTLNVMTAVRDVSADLLRTYNNDTASLTSIDGTTSSLTNTLPLRIGYGTGTSYNDFELYGAAVWRRVLTPAEVVTLTNHYNGTITSGSTSLLQEAVFWIDANLSQQAASIGRASSGGKSVAVTKSCWLFGSTDYLEIPDNPLLNFSASESFTAIAVTRFWDTPTAFAPIIGKQTTTNNTSAGWTMYHQGGSPLPYAVPGVVADGTTAAFATQAEYTLGQQVMFSMVVNRSTQNINSFNGSSNPAGNGSSTSSIGSLVNSNPMLISKGGTSYMELFGAAVWRRALSTTELTTLNNHFNGTVTTASTALLQEAVFWIDPNLSQQAAAIVRSTSGRKSVAVTRPTMLFGTDDYLEVPDAPLLNFGATDSFTVLWAGREWSTSTNFGRYVDKMTTGNIGWRVFNSGTTMGRSVFDIGDGTNAVGTGGFSLAFTAGSVATVTAVRNVTGDYITHYTNGVWVGGNQSDLTTGSLTNTAPVRIGISSAGGNQNDFEFYGAAIWRRALSASEVSTINNHYNGNITSISTALLQEAVLWIDPKIGLENRAVINRASSGRKTVAVTRPTLLFGTTNTKSSGNYVTNLGTGGSAIDALRGSTTATGTDTVDPLWLTHYGTNYLYLPGVSATNYASTPDSPATSVTGNLEMVCRVALDDWTLSGQGLIIKDDTSVPSRGFTWFTTTGGALRFDAFQDTAGTVLSTANSPTMASVGVSAGQTVWLKVTFEPNIGATSRTTFFWAPDAPTEPTTWNTLAQLLPTALTGIADSSAQLAVGNRPANALPAAGKFYRAIVRNGIGGTTVFDADFTAGITSGAQTTFTESSSNAATVTIARATSGRKSVAVTRPVMLFGVDDYLEVVDNPLLDFANNESFTMFTAVRAWPTISTNQRLISKNDSVGATAAYYRLYLDSATGNPFISTGDGTITSGAFGTTQPVTLGNLRVAGAIRDTSLDVYKVFSNTTISTGVVDSLTGSMANASVLRIGSSSPTVGTYFEGEFFGAAIFRRALTSTEIALINTHYTVGATAESIALLQQAVFWIDSNLSNQDDHLKILDNPAVDFDNNQDFTFLALARTWGVPASDQAIISKETQTSLGSGWSLVRGASNLLKANIKDSTGTKVSTSSLTLNQGQFKLLYGRRDSVANKLYVGSDTSTVSVTDTTTTSLASDKNILIGRQNFYPDSPLDAEIFAVMILPSKLTDEELLEIYNYYNNIASGTSIDTMNKLSGTLSRLLNRVQRLEKSNHV